MKPRNILLLRRMSLAPSLGAALLVAGAFVGWLILAGAHPANASTLETRSTLVRGEYDAQTSGKADHTCGATSGAVSGENVVLTSAVIAKEDLKGVYVQFEIYSRSRGISGVLDSPSKYHLDLDEGDIGEFSTTIDTILHPGDDWTARCTVRANHPSIPFVDETVSAEKTASFTVGPMTYGDPRSWLSSCDPSQNVQRVVPGAAISIVAIGRAENDTTAEKSGYRIFGHIYKDGEKKNEYVWRRSATGGNKLLFENSFNAPESPGRYTLDCVLVTENLNYDLLNRIKNVQSCQSGHYVPAVAACVASLSLAERVVWRPVWIISFTFCVGDESDCPGTSPGAGTTATEPPPTEGTTPEPAPVTPVPPPAPPPAPEPPSSSDRAALIALYNSTSGTRWINNLQGRETWLIGQSGSGLDDWYGVETHDNGRVKYLLLEFDNNLHGTLPPRLGNLTESLVLSVKGNERDGRSLLGVRGSIPGELGNLSALHELYLSNNELTGGIPEALGNLSELDTLDLSDNRLSGNIPATLGNLILLRDLDLSGNRLEGDIPAALAKLTDLESLYLSGGSNTFTGCIPSGLRRSAVILSLLSCVQVESLRASEIAQTENPVDGHPQSKVYDAEVTDIDVDPDPVQNGSSTISVDVKNLSATNGPHQGRATFDIRLIIDPPGLRNTVYAHWNDVSFSSEGTETLSLDHTFTHLGDYELTAEVYDNGGLASNWSNSRRFDDATRKERFHVNEPYDAEVTDIDVDPDPVQNGSSTISVDVKNLSATNGPHQGRATFDIRLIIDPPGLRNTVYAHWNDVSFSSEGTETLSLDHTFTHLGDYELTAEVYDNGGLASNWSNSRRFDDATRKERFHVNEPYDAEVTDIDVDPDPVQNGSSTISVDVKNLSATNGPDQGRATFDIRLIIDPPGLRNTVYAHWNDVSFSSEGTETLSLDHTFTHLGDYELTAEVYDNGGLASNWSNSRRFDDATRKERFHVDVAAVAVDLAIEIKEQVTPVVGQWVSIPVTLRNDGQGPSGRFDIAVYFQKLEGGPQMPADPAPRDTPTGEAGLIRSLGAEENFLWADNYKAPRSDQAEPGEYRLCGKILHPNQNKDSNESNDESCTLVFLLPETGEDFREELEAYHFPDDDMAEREGYWVIVPRVYLDHAIVAEGISERTWGGFEHRNDRIKLYKELILDVIRRREISGNTIVKLDIAEEVQGQVIDATNFADVANDIVGGVEAFEHLAGTTLLMDNLRHLGTGTEILKDGLIIGEAGFDTVITAALNRTIEVEEARTTLRLLQNLQEKSPSMDDAWAEAISRARTDVRQMTSQDELERWGQAVEENFDDLSKAISKIVVTKVATKVTITVAAKALGVSVSVISWPVSLTVGLAVAAVYHTIDQTGTFWHEVSLAATAAQLYLHLYVADLSEKENILDYTKFAFYQHLDEAAQIDFAGTNLLGRRTPKDHQAVISQRRDSALAEASGLNWDPDKDFKVPETDNSKDVWSDGKTMWVLSGNPWGIGGGHEIHGYDFNSKSRDESQDLKFGRLAATPVGISSDSTATTMWVADQFWTHPLFAYNIEGRMRDESKEFDIVNPQGIYVEGATMWVLNRGNVFAYGLDGAAQNEKRINVADDKAVTGDPRGIWANADTVWIAEDDFGRITAYSKETKEHVPSLDIVTVKVPGIADNSRPAGIWSDGHTMWVADRESDRIFAYALPYTLSAPLNLKADTTGESQVDLTWDAPTDTGANAITGYIAQESEDGNNWSSLSEDTGSAVTSYSRTGLGEWTSRSYRVAAISGERLGPWSDTATATRAAPAITYVSCYPRKVLVGREVNCSPRFSGGDAPGYTYSWTALMGAVGDPWKGAGEQFTTKWNSAGNRSVSLMVCDPVVSRCSSKRQDIQVVENTAPAVTLESPERFARVRTGVSMEFTATAYDPDGNFASWEWTVNGVRAGGEAPIPDGRFDSFYSTRAEVSFSNTFSGADSYEVEVRFTDGEGATGSAKWEVYASSPSSAEAPTIADIIMTGDGSAFTTLWEPPDNTAGSTPTSYDLRYAKRVDDAGPVWTTVTGAWQTGFPLRATVRNLSGGDARYDVQMRAVYGGSVGPWSATFIAAPQPEVLITDFASEFAIEGSAPTDTTLDVRLLPPDMDYDLPRLEITIFDEDGFSNRPGTDSVSDSENSVLSPGSVTVAVPGETWVAYGESTLEIHMAGRWIAYSQEIERALVAAEALGIGRTGFITGRSLMPGLFGVSRSLGAFQDWQAGGKAESDIDEVFGEDHLNCFTQVGRSWRVPVGLPAVLLNALAGDFGFTQGVRITIPVSLDVDDYVSLAANFVGSETGEGETSLIQVVDLLSTGQSLPACQRQ